MEKFKLKRRYKFNSKLFVLLFGLTLIISVGFAYVQSSFSINGVANINDGAWDVHFDNISVSTNMETTTEPVLNARKDSISFTLTLKYRTDYYEIEADVVNSGVYNAKVKDYTSMLIPTELAPYINLSFTYADGSAISANDILTAGSRRRLKIKYSFKLGFKELSIPLKTYTVDFKLPYVQVTS